MKGRQSNNQKHLLFGKAGVFILNKKKRVWLLPVLAVLMCVAITGCGAAGGERLSGSADQREGSLSGETADQAGEDNFADGTYVPSSFAFSGGSGRVEITCPSVTVRDGEAEAEIVFSSSHYTRVVLNDTEYLPARTDVQDESHFVIPLVLDEETEITATTTAMSEPHDINYTICVSLSEGADSSYTGDTAAGTDHTASRDSESDPDAVYESDFDAKTVSGLTYVSQMETKYAETFSVYEYEEGYRIIEVSDSACYLVIPEGKEAPENLPDHLIVLQQPLDTVYLAATSAMSLYQAIGALQDVKYTGTDSSGWHIDAPKEALKSGAMVYAGKYSAPDYELLLGGGVDLAVESMMILHTPEVKEKLNDLGIPVFIDNSSRESHPLGRTEWIRVYGILAGKEAEADACFEEEASRIEAILQNSGNEETAKETSDHAASKDNSAPTIAFFSISSDGTVTVRRSDDYIANMIEMAGGSYVSFDADEDSSSGASLSVSMEAFYAGAKDADILIYNSAIEDALESADALVGKDAVFADFRAVQSGQVWQVKKSLYQSTDCVGELILDLNSMLEGTEDTDMKFLEHLT
ncbi:MAG: ABC transporter substrate-binding protein [Lachnospiraceae bacterium]|nr:ABC transporter substrate-binding protein [Lachnospiraceae bacterium]